MAAISKTCHDPNKVQVTILASEWGSRKGGRSTISRELAIHLAKFPEVQITYFLPKCSEEDRKVAVSHGIKILEATPLVGFAEMDSFSFPPVYLQIDVVVGHGVKLGHRAQVIRESHECMWLQVVHAEPEELGMFKCYENPISLGKEKHNIEVELCKMANFVVGVGPKLAEAFRKYLRSYHKDQTVFDFTPGIIDEFVSVQKVPKKGKQCSVLVFGHGDAEDFELKGFGIAARSVAALHDTRLVFVGTPDGKHEEIENRLLECGIPKHRLRVRGYIKRRESLKRLFSEVDLVLVPTRTEGFSLTGLEALSAGLPVIVSKNSGFGEALSNVPFGSSFVIGSKDPSAWTEAIKDVWKKNRQTRLDEVKVLRDSYKVKYSWSDQCEGLLKKILYSVNAASYSRQTPSEAQGRLNIRDSEDLKDIFFTHHGVSRKEAIEDEKESKIYSGKLSGPVDVDVSTLLKRLELPFPSSLRGKWPEGANFCQDINIGSCHSADGTKERGNDLILILRYCKQKVLRHLDDTLLDFNLLSGEYDDDSFSPTNCLYALGTLAFKQGNIECLEKVQTIVLENYDFPDASIVMNDLGVMLTLKAMYKISEQCFAEAKKWFQQEEDHLKNAIVTLNLGALYMILGEYEKACDFCNDAANLCHDITMRSTKDPDLPMKVLRRAADLLIECGNFEKFCHILRIGGKYNFGARKVSKTEIRKWLMEIELKEQTGEKIEEQELKDCGSYLLILLEKPDAQSVNADLIKTVFAAAKVSYRNGLCEEALKLFGKLEAAFLSMGGREHLLYGLMLFQVGRFKHGCGMTSDAENDLKQADAILIKHFERNHVVAHCKKLLGFCAFLNNNLVDASTNLTEALSFFRNLNSQHFEVVDISLKLAQLQIEERNFECTREILNEVQKAVEMLKYSFAEISSKTGSVHVQAGLILQKVDRGAAIDEVKKAVEIYLSLGLQPEHPVIKLCQGVTGLFQLCLGNKEEAEKYFVDALKDSPIIESCNYWFHHDLMHEVDKLFTEFNTGYYFKERPLYQSAKMFSLVSLVAMKKGKDDRQKYLDALVRFAEESDTEEQGIIDFAGYCCFVSHISCLAGPNVYVLIFPDPEFSSQFSNDDEVMISRFKNSSCILFWRTFRKIQEMKELRNLDFLIRESVSTLFLQPKFRKCYEETDDFYLELPLGTLSLCSQIDRLPLLVELKLDEPQNECTDFDYLTSWALGDSSPEPAVRVSYLSCEFSNKRTAELAFDYLVLNSNKEPLLNDVKAVEVTDGHSPYMNFAFFTSRHSRYSNFCVFVDKELPVLKVKCRHLNESKSNGFCFSVQSALQNVMLSLCEAVRICFKPFVQLSCEGHSTVGIRESSNINCSSAVKTESSVTSPQGEGVISNACASDCFTEKELDFSTKHVLNTVTSRGSSSESSNQKPFSSNKTSLGCANAQVLKSDCDKECHVSTLENQEVCSGSHADVYLRLLEYLLSDRNVTPEHEALNSVVPDSGVEERSLLSADFLSASSWNSVPVSPESFCSRDSLPSASSSPSGCISLHEKFEGEPCEWSDVDLADSCLAKVQSKSETKETHQYAEMCQLKSQLSEEETPDNCDSIDGVLKPLESNVTCEAPFGESKECPDVQIGENCHPQCKIPLVETELSAAEVIGVRGSRNSGIDCFVLSKDEESATFQNNCSELQEQINKLQEKLRQTEAEKQQLKADLGRYLFLEDREKRSGKLLSAPRAFTSDESRCCGGSTASKCLSVNGRLLGGTASLQDKPDFNLQARFIEISNSLSPEEFKQMKILARGKVDGFRLAKMKVGFELLKEVERVSEHPCTDMGELLKGIQRFDLLEKLGLPYPESKTSESAGTSSASSPSRDDQGGERCTTLKSCTSTMGFAHRSEDNGQKFTPDHVYDLSASASFNIDSENPVSINIEDNDPLSMESVGTNDKEGICVPVSSEQSGPSSGASSVCVNALRTAEGSPVCSRSSSQGSSKKSAKAPEVVLTSHSASAPGEIANESNLNTGSREEEGPGQAQVMNCTDDVTDGGNTEVENIKGQSVDSFYGASGTTPSDTKTFPLSVSEYDSQIDSSDSSSFCRSTDPVSSHVDDANPLQLQQSSNVHGQTTLRMHESDESSSSSTDWERLGARPKISQRQRPQVAISPPPPPPIASPVSDGLAGDFLVRHSQDKAVHESLYANGRDFSFLGNDTSQVTSFVDGKTNALEAYRVRPYFGACQAAAVGNKSYVRSDGIAFSNVSIGGIERVGLLGGSFNNESLYGNSAHGAAAPLRNQTGLSNVTLGWNGSSRNGVNNVDGLLNIEHGVTGQKDYSRESYFPSVQHNTHTHWQSNTVSEITRSGFAYGLTSSDFTLTGSGVAGIRPLPSVYTTQRHVMSDGDSAFKDEQAVNERSHNADLALGHQSLANINRHHVLGTSASAGSAVIVDNCGLPPPFSISSSSVSSTTVVSTTTSRSLVVSASNHTRSLVNSTSRNSVVSSTTSGDGNSETSLAPSSRNADEDNSRGALLNRDNGTNDIEPIDDSLLALERRVADASALVERVLREREEREQFEREIERKERMIRERRERERREREEREIQEAEQWPQQQEAVSARSPWLCEHYQRHCRVRFPCCTQFYPCHRCHNTSRNCENEEAKACHATHLKCSFCEHEQEIDENSGVCGKCGKKMAAYFCSICKHFTNVDKNPYHCEKCGICRIHADKSFHCDVCNVCLDKRLKGNHKCRPDSGHDECCICLEDAFSGCQILPCSHKVHRECAIAMIQNGIRTCPVCRHPLYSAPSE
ncbi:uncharacterized protein [Montipora capricornis]|uniref:uncharacterized protein isoform X1 n=2 Tax=Montipora capricornis TaxID=246305 RepID=UPI0035F0FF10